MFWEIIWIVLMILWLLGGGFVTFRPAPDPPYYRFFGYCLIPWLCVAILGGFVFGAFAAAPGVFR